MLSATSLLKQPLGLGSNHRSHKGEGQLLGGAGVLLAPELKKQSRVRPPDKAEPVDPGMAGAAEGEEPGEAGVARATVMDDERGRAVAGGGTQTAEPAVAKEDGGAVPGKVLPVPLFAGIAGGAEAAPGD